MGKGDVKPRKGTGEAKGKGYAKMLLHNAVARVISNRLVESSIVDDLCKSFDGLDPDDIRIHLDGVLACVKAAKTDDETVKILKDALLKARKDRLYRLSEVAVNLGFLDRADVDLLCEHLGTAQLDLLCNTIPPFSHTERGNKLKEKIQEIKKVVEVTSQSDPPLPPPSDPEPPLPPPSDLEPDPISQGSTGTDYELIRQCVILDHKSDSEARFYEGWLIFKGNGGKKEKRHACFLVCDNFEFAMKILDSSQRITHNRVMRALTIVYDDSICRNLVAFTRFLNLEVAKKDDFLAKRLVTCSSADGDLCLGHEFHCPVPGNPNVYVMEEIREIVEAYEYMLQKRFSCTAFFLVWCPMSSCVKILFIDTEISGWGDHKVEDHLGLFAEALCDRFLNDLPHKICPDWPERERFRSCFSRASIPIQQRLKMVLSHSFLQDGVGAILDFFPRIWDEIQNFGLPTFVDSINREVFLKEFCGKGLSWRKEQWCDAFERVYNYDPEETKVEETGEVIKKPKYETNQMKQHIRFLRNVHQHGKLSMLEFYKQVRLCWPGLIEAYHVVSYDSFVAKKIPRINHA